MSRCSARPVPFRQGKFRQGKLWAGVLGLAAAMLLAGCTPVTRDAAPAAQAVAAATPAATPTVTSATQVSATQSCSPTAPDMLGPFYVPNAPERSKVGTGYVLQGAVLGADNCKPLPGAMIELWMANPSGQYTDDMRATMYADAQGRYTFESSVAVPYSGRPPHIHLKVSAPGYATLVTQHYPKAGATSATFDIVLSKGS